MCVVCNTVVPEMWFYMCANIFLFNSGKRAPDAIFLPLLNTIFMYLITNRRCFECNQKAKQEGTGEEKRHNKHHEPLHHSRLPLYRRRTRSESALIWPSAGTFCNVRWGRLEEACYVLCRVFLGCGAASRRDGSEMFFKRAPIVATLRFHAPDAIGLNFEQNKRCNERFGVLRARIDTYCSYSTVDN